jgi:pectate lyase
MAYVDDANRFAESDETNNQRSSSVTDGTSSTPTSSTQEPAVATDSGTTTTSDWKIQGFAAAEGVTGGAGGQNIVVTNLNSSGSGSLSNAINAAGTRTITFTPGLTGTINFTNVVYVPYDNMTIDGAGANITISGYSLSVFKPNGTPVQNIIIKNLRFLNTTSTRNAVNIEYGSYNIWVDHCTFSNNSTGNIGQGIAIWDRGLGIGGLTGITLSWNKFESPNKKSLLISAGDDYTKISTQVSVHHNWFDNVSARSPRLGAVSVHMWNNYISNWTEYGTAISGEGDLLLQNNIYENDGDDTAVDSNYGGIVANSVNATGNLLLGSPRPVIETRGTFPSEVITYTPNLETADNTLKQRLIQGAGTAWIK